MIKWFKKWHEWQARCINGKFYKLMVLFKIIKSPSMQNIITQHRSELQKTKHK